MVAAVRSPDLLLTPDGGSTKPAATIALAAVANLTLLGERGTLRLSKTGSGSGTEPALLVTGERMANGAPKLLRRTVASTLDRLGTV